MLVHSRASQVALVVKSPPASAGDVRDAGSIPGSGRSPGGGNGITLQYSCWENPMDRGAWRATYSPWGHKELDPNEHIWASSFETIIKLWLCAQVLTCATGIQMICILPKIKGITRVEWARTRIQTQLFWFHKFRGSFPLFPFSTNGRERMLELDGGWTQWPTRFGIASHE